MCVTRENERPSDPLEGEVAFSLRFFNCGVHLPLQLKVANLLRDLGFAP